MAQTRYSYTLVAISLAAQLSNAQAEIMIQPEVSTRAFYDNNPRLRIDPATEVAATVNEIVAETVYARPTYSVVLTPKFRLSRYTEDTELDSEDYFVKLEGLKSMEKSQLAGEFNYEREASFTTEQTDSDRLNINVPRTTFSANSSWLYSLSEKSYVTFFGNALDVSFEDPPPLTLIDYLQFGAGTSISHAISDRTTLNATLSVSQFKTPQIGSKTLSYIYQFGFEYQFDETLSTSFRIGNNISHLDFKSTQTQLISLVPLRFSTSIVDGSGRSSGEIINLTVVKDLDRATLGLEWDRSFSPSSQGSRRRSQRVYGYGRYDFSRSFDGILQVTYRESAQERSGILLRADQRETLDIRGTLRYDISKIWRAELGLRYREIKRANGATKSDSQRVFLTLRYSPDKFNYKP